MTDLSPRASNSNRGVEEFLARPLTAHLATQGPHVRPVWFLWEEAAFWVISGPWSTVPDEIGRDPHVALVVSRSDMDTGDTKQVVVRGEAHLLPWDQERGWRLLRRYLGDDVNTWDERFQAYLRGEPGCVWVRLAVGQPNLMDLSFAPSRPHSLFLPDLGEITDVRRLAGGAVHRTWLVTRSDGSQVVVKEAGHVPEALFVTEAEGLATIAAMGRLSTPGVLHAGPNHLVLEALQAPPSDDDRFWEEAGRAVAALHANPGPAFGWHRDNWLGLLPQRNRWCDDGHEFFVRNRILRYLEEPKTLEVLGTGDISGIERICAKFHDLVPVMPPVLTHGDLWSGNCLATLDGHPAVADPAVAYTWAEVDISMMSCEHPPPTRFFDAYHEVHPAEPGWRERIQLLHLRELLSVIAHLGDTPGLCEPTLTRVRAVVARYG